MTGPVAIAVSGGVDSLVAAYLLKREGHDVFGIHFLTGYEPPAASDNRRIAAIGRQLNIPVEVVDLKKPFQAMVVDYFTDAYQHGETPNPCLVCNHLIKFGALLAAARQRGAAVLATGHYARADKGPSGRMRLLKGMDPDKDQSYFLSRLTRDQLARAYFPLGVWTKSDVKELARQNGLVPTTRNESQDVCFIHDTAYTDFLVTTIGIDPRPGDIVDTAGKRVGRHNGLHRYTIGQRRGINCPASEAYYVIRIDALHNRLVVGFKDDLRARSCRVREVNWIADIPESPIAVDTRIRYRHRAVASTLVPDGNDRVLIRFDQPQAAVTPGQGAVFYRGDEVLGGGWIES